MALASTASPLAPTALVFVAGLPVPGCRERLGRADLHANLYESPLRARKCALGQAVFFLPLSACLAFSSPPSLLDGVSERACRSQSSPNITSLSIVVLATSRSFLLFHHQLLLILLLLPFLSFPITLVSSNILQLSAPTSALRPNFYFDFSRPPLFQHSTICRGLDVSWEKGK